MLRSQSEGQLWIESCESIRLLRCQVDLLWIDQSADRVDIVVVCGDQSLLCRLQCGHEDGCEVLTADALEHRLLVAVGAAGLGEQGSSA